MKKKKEKVQEPLKQLADEFIDTIISMSDKDILKEAKEDYEEPSYEANKIRKMINNNWIKAGKNRLHAAQEELKKIGNKHQRKEASPKNPKEELAKFIYENPELADEYTLAARNGKDISEEDALGLLEDLQELKDMEDKKKDK